MKITSYLNDLLYRYDCVIIPDFGGFVTQQIGATFHKSTQTFQPPSKRISFNHLLNKNDGLLINYVATAENISYEKASNAIALTVIKWQKELQKNKVVLDNIGSLSLNENKQIVFEPDTSTNFSTNAFGLASVKTKYAVRPKKEVVSINATTTENPTKKKVPAFIKYAATAAILLTIGFAGNSIYQEKQQQTLLTNQQNKLKKRIQSATFKITNPLPALELNVTKKVSKPYHVVAGAFQFPENALKRVNQLTNKGYNAKIIGVNEWGLTQVVYESFVSRNNAINYLNKIRKEDSKDAWLLAKK